MNKQTKIITIVLIALTSALIITSTINLRLHIDLQQQSEAFQHEIQEKRKLRAREIERRQFQYEEFGQDHLTCSDRDQSTGSGIPILTWRFGGGSSKTTLRKHYASHRTNLSKHREFRLLNNVSKSLSYRSPLSTKEVMPMR